MYPLPLRCNPNQLPEIVNPYLALALDLDTAVVSDLVLSAPEGSPTYASGEPILNRGQ